MKIANLPDGWTQRDGAAYAGVTLSFSEGNTVFAVTHRRTVPPAQVKAERALDDVRKLAKQLRRTRRPDLERAADALLLQAAEQLAAIVREVEGRFSPASYQGRTGA